MDLHLTPGVEQLSNTHPMNPHHEQMPQHKLLLKQETLHQNLCQQIDWEHYYKCKRQTPFANIFQNDCQMKAPKHETNLFIHVKGLLYKHITDSHQKFLALIISKAWKYTVLVKAHKKLGHQGSTWTYCLIK